MPEKDLERELKQLERQMQDAARNLEFEKAAEMRDRILERLHEASRLSQFNRARWRDLKDRLSDIAISTIDAFCLSLLREFPLEADVDPGFNLADDTETPIRPPMYAASGTSMNDSGTRFALMSGMLAASREVRLLTSTNGCRYGS